MNAPVSAPRRSNRADSGTALRIFSALTGLVVLAVLLQGLWAGIFLEHDGQRDDAAGWIDVHARCGEIAILLAAVAAVWAGVRLHGRRDLLVGAVVLTVLLVLEAYLGGLIRDDGKDVLTAVHVPLALLIMGMGVWVTFRAFRTRPAT
jgi:hypothetical protein